MKGKTAWGFAIAAWLIGGILQQSLPLALPLWGFSPFYQLVALALVTLYTNRGISTVSGFLCGLFDGAILGINMAELIFSRTLAGFLGGWAFRFGFQRSFTYVVLHTFALVVFAQVLYMILAPPPDLGDFLVDTLKGALSSGILAGLLHAAVERIPGLLPQND
jgi:cell shape-determining protein MreD